MMNNNRNIYFLSLALLLLFNTVTGCKSKKNANRDKSDTHITENKHGDDNRETDSLSSVDDLCKLYNLGISKTGISKYPMSNSPWLRQIKGDTVFVYSYLRGNNDAISENTDISDNIESLGKIIYYRFTKSNSCLKPIEYIELKQKIKIINDKLMFPSKDSEITRQIEFGVKFQKYYPDSLYVFQAIFNTKNRSFYRSVWLDIEK